MELLKIVLDKDFDLNKVYENASKSYKNNKEIVFITMVVTLLILDNDKKRKIYFKPIVSDVIKLFLSIHILAYAFFTFLDYKFPSDENPNLSVKTMYDWIIKPILYNRVDSQFIPNTLFGENFIVVEYTFRLYIAVIVIIKILSIVNEHFNLTNALWEFLLYSFTTLVLVALCLFSLKYLNVLTIICIVPFFFTLLTLSIDRFIMLLHTRTNMNVKMNNHKKIVNYFKDIFFNIECKNKLYSIHVNNNFIFIITSVMFSLNLCYQVYNININEQISG